MPWRAGSPRAARHHPFRSFGSVVLILVAALLAMLSVVAVWANSIVQDTDRYVKTVGPLASDPDVQKAATNRISAAVLAQIDVDALVQQLTDAASAKGVPPQAAKLLGNLDGPIESGLKQLVTGTVERVVTSNAFETVWVNGNRRAHAALVKALTGEADGTVKVENNQVVIDLGPIVAEVKDQLVAAGFTPAAKIPAVHTNFVVFASKDLGKIRSYVRVLEILGGWLPVIALLIAAAGVYVAFNRRHALIGAALAVFAAMLLLGIGLTVFRDVYLNHLPSGVSQAAAGSVYDALVKFLRAGIRALAAVALFTAVGAFLAGPSRIAVVTRTGCRRSIGALRDDDLGGPAARGGRAVRPPLQALDRGGHPGGRGGRPVHLDLPHHGGRGVDGGDHLGCSRDPRVPGPRRLHPVLRPVLRPGHRGRRRALTRLAGCLRRGYVECGSP